MPFSHTPKNPGDLIKSEDWNKALTAIVELFAKFAPAGGHTHNGTGESGPPIAEAGIAANAITNAKIANGAVNAVKIQDGTITAAKIAPGQFSRDTGISFVMTLSDGQSIPPPSGFTAQECIFFVAATSLSCTGQPTAQWNYTVKVNAEGRVAVVKSNNITISISGLAMAKRGGW